MSCPADNEMVEPRIDRVLTQYRESPKLLHVLRTHLRQVEMVVQSICDLPSFFDLDTAVGDQLTLLGKRLGWPRCHCVCEVQPVFGFECEGFPSSGYVVTGFCDDNQTWSDCGSFSLSEVCVNDDELYRKFLKVRRYQMLALFDIQSLEEAIRTLWGPKAWVVHWANGRVVVAPGRLLSEFELQFAKLYPRVLPVSPGIRVQFHYGTRDVFGFGEGWGGFCEEEQEEDVFLVTGDGDQIVDENNNPLLSSPFRISEWMCPIDVNPYDC